MNSQNKVEAARSDDNMFVVGGAVSTLYITDGTVNLLQGMQSKMAAAGLGSAMADMAGGVANAAMVAMYEGESVQHFGCYIGEQMVIGSFPGVGFKEGEEVKAVVTRLDERVVFAHAVVRTTDARLWMPHSVDKGRYAIAIWIAKLMGWISLAGWSCQMVYFLFNPPKGGFFEEAWIFAAGFVSLSLAAVFFVTRSSPEGPYAERIFKVLGFKKPKIVNLSPFCEQSLGIKTYHQGGSIQIYDLRAALKAYGSLSKTTSVNKP